MYGFHKMPHQQNFENCWVFSHPAFQKGKPELLSEVKRKVVTKEGTSSGDIDLIAVLSELSAIRQQQIDISADLNVLQRNSQLLWNEVFTARERYLKQQETIDKLLRFLASIFSPKTVKQDLLPKRRRLLLEDKDSLESAQKKVKELFQNESETSSIGKLKDRSSSFGSDSISRLKDLKETKDKADDLSDHIDSLQDNIDAITNGFSFDQDNLDLEEVPDFLKIMGFDDTLNVDHDDGLDHTELNANDPTTKADSKFDIGDFIQDEQ